MIKLFFYTLLIIVSFPIFAQKIVTIQPGAKKGKDAYIFYLKNQKSRFGATNDLNYGTKRKLPISEWTWDGNVGTTKTLIEFDLKQIPKKSKVISAKLSLYFYIRKENEYKEEHSQLSGSNECWIEKITSEWNEESVTWNTQPTVSKENRILLHASNDPKENYENIDITPLIQEMVNNPKENNGIMLSMKTQEHYRRLIFASSDYGNSKYHPKLIVTYENKGTQAQKEKFNFFKKQEPNNKVECNKLMLLIFDKDYNFISKNEEIDISELNSIINNLEKGEYIFQLIDQKQNINSFNIKK